MQAHRGGKHPSLLPPSLPPREEAPGPAPGRSRGPAAGARTGGVALPGTRSPAAAARAVQPSSRMASASASSARAGAYPCCTRRVCIASRAHPPRTTSARARAAAERRSSSAPRRRAASISASTSCSGRPARRSASRSAAADTSRRASVRSARRPDSRRGQRCYASRCMHPALGRYMDFQTAWGVWQRRNGCAPGRADRRGIHLGGAGAAGPLVGGGARLRKGSPARGGAERAARPRRPDREHRPRGRRADRRARWSGRGARWRQRARRRSRWRRWSDRCCSRRRSATTPGGRLRRGVRRRVPGHAGTLATLTPRPGECAGDRLRRRPGRGRAAPPADCRADPLRRGLVGGAGPDLPRAPGDGRDPARPEQRMALAEFVDHLAEMRLIGPRRRARLRRVLSELV